MRVLLIEDDLAISHIIKSMLSRAGMVVDTTVSGEEGLELAKSLDYDLVLLDLFLPDLNGHDVLRRLRFARVDTSVIILSGAGDAENKVRGLDLGADDYLTKPFVREELFSRIRAIVRRSRGFAQPIIRTGRLEVNLEAKTAYVSGGALMLTHREYQILELLSLRKGDSLTKETFLNHLYGGVDEPEVTAIEVYICKLRKKLILATEGEIVIETIRCRGYRLVDPEPTLEHSKANTQCTR